MWFQVLFHSPKGVLFTIFARATGSLSVAEEYLALGGGPPRFRPGFPCPTLLGCRIRRTVGFVYGAITLSGVLSSVLRLPTILLTPAGIQIYRASVPRPLVHNAFGLTCTRFRLCPFRSPLLRTSTFLSLPGVTKMFQFTPLAPTDYAFTGG